MWRQWVWMALFKKTCCKAKETHWVVGERVLRLRESFLQQMLSTNFRPITNSALMAPIAGGVGRASAPAVKTQSVFTLAQTGQGRFPGGGDV